MRYREGTSQMLPEPWTEAFFLNAALSRFFHRGKVSLERNTLPTAIACDVPVQVRIAGSEQVLPSGVFYDNIQIWDIPTAAYRHRGRLNNNLNGGRRLTCLTICCRYHIHPRAARP